MQESCLMKLSLQVRIIKMTTQTLTQQFEELLKGCNKNIKGNYGCNSNDRKCGSRNRLCPTCKAKLNTFISVCEDELGFLEIIKDLSEKTTAKKAYSDYLLSLRLGLEEKIEILQNIIKRGKEI